MFLIFLYGFSVNSSCAKQQVGTRSTPVQFTARADIHLCVQAFSGDLALVLLTSLWAYFALGQTVSFFAFSAILGRTSSPFNRSLNQFRMQAER